MPAPACRSWPPGEAGSGPSGSAISAWIPRRWNGSAMRFGPQVGTRVTFMRPDQAAPRWAGIPDPEIAGPIAVAAYLRTYGPATVAGFRRWMGASDKSALGLFKRMGDR